MIPVIRRELRQMDGTWLSNEAVDLSEARLNRTGSLKRLSLIPSVREILPIR